MHKALSSTKLIPVVCITVLIQTLLTLSSTVPVAIAPELTKNLDLPPASIGYFVSIVYGGAMAASVFGGGLNRRWGPVRISQSALLCAAIGSLLLTGSSLFLVIMGAFFIGLGYGLTNPAASELLSRVVNSSNRNMIFSIKQTGVPLGAVLAGLIAPSIVILFNQQIALYLTSGVLLVAAFLLQIIRPAWDTGLDPNVKFKNNPFKNLSVVWHNPAIKYLALASFFFSAIQMSLGAFTVTMLVDDIDFGLVQAGFVLSLVQASGAIGRIFWGRIADHINNGIAVLMALAFVSGFASLLTATLDPQSGAVLIYGVFILFGLSSIGWNGVFMAEVARMVPADRIAAATGSALFVTFAGVLVGPSLFSLMHMYFQQFDIVFAIMALMPAFGFICALLAHRNT